jgi:mannose-1-phosphate guanylyltransferase
VRYQTNAIEFEVSVRHMAHTWAVVLAGGDGSRLRKMTTDASGLVVPKQYCSIESSSCLLQEAVARASSVVLPGHVCSVVAAQHRRWWSTALSGMNEANIMVQPHNRGTALGVLFALLTLEMRNPAATVTLMPADHYFRDEAAITRALRAASNLASANPQSVYLMGTEPDSSDPELGYILPADKVGDVPVQITGFKEKPSAEHARELIALGALWNLFMLAGSVQALLALFDEDYRELVDALRQALKLKPADQRDALEALYSRLSPVDFSSDVLEIQAGRLTVMRVLNCGWTDLGTPQRVEATVRKLYAGADLSTKKPKGAPLFFRLGTVSA